MNNNLGNRIRTARESVGMTQTELAKSIGTTQAMIYRYETGEQEPTVSRLTEIANALNIRPSELLEDAQMNETKLIVNGVWNVQALPNHYVVELADGKLAKFFITPFRSIKDSDLTLYAGHDPRKVGDPMPDYLYRFYGLQMTALVPANVTIWEENGVRYMSDDQDTVELAEDITADQVYWSDIDGYIHADGTPIKTK